MHTLKTDQCGKLYAVDVNQYYKQSSIYNLIYKTTLTL